MSSHRTRLESRKNVKNKGSVVYKILVCIDHRYKIKGQVLKPFYIHYDIFFYVLKDRLMSEILIVYP